MLLLHILAASTIVVATINHFFLNVDATALDDYVWKTDESYGWTELDYVIKGKVVGRGYTGWSLYFSFSLFRFKCFLISLSAYALNMTSQRWLTDADFSPSSNSKSLWWHYLVILILYST